MKRLLWILVLCVPGLAFAQQPNVDRAEMMRRIQDPEAMRRMAQEAEAAQKCMDGIEQKEIDTLQKRSEAASREIDQLCAAGKRDEALAKGLALAEEMRGDATVQKIRECTRGMSEMMQSMPWAQLPGVKDEPDPTDRDICS